MWLAIRSPSTLGITLTTGASGSCSTKVAVLMTPGFCWYFQLGLDGVRRLTTGVGADDLELTHRRAVGLPDADDRHPRRPAELVDEEEARPRLVRLEVTEQRVLGDHQHAFADPDSVAGQLDALVVLRALGSQDDDPVLLDVGVYVQ